MMYLSHYQTWRFQRPTTFIPFRMKLRMVCLVHQRPLERFWGFSSSHISQWCGTSKIRFYWMYAADHRPNALKTFPLSEQSFRKGRFEALQKTNIAFKTMPYLHKPHFICKFRVISSNFLSPRVGTKHFPALSAAKISYEGSEYVELASFSWTRYSDEQWFIMMSCRIW